MKHYQTHADVRGRDGYGYVINVKYHGAYRLPGGGTDEQRQRAYENAMRSWWYHAEQAARHMGFDTVYSCGRSGGYIYPVLNGSAITPSDLDRSQYGYGREHARCRIGMLRKFRIFITERMADDYLARMFADELEAIIADDREELQDTIRENRDSFAVLAAELRNLRHVNAPAACAILRNSLRKAANNVHSAVRELQAMREAAE